MASTPFPESLGDVVADWIERNCVHGPGDVFGEPVRLTDEEHDHLTECYRLDPQTGRRTVDIGVYSRRKGTRKSELGAWLVAAECVGPVRAALDDRGRAVAQPVRDPWILCAATTEDQSELVYGAFTQIAQASPKLAPHFDPGQELTYLTDRPGRVAASQTGNPIALDGHRPTFQVLDEIHLWYVAALLKSYSTVRRNLRKRRLSQPWMWMPTTAYQPNERSIAEELHETAKQHPEGDRPRALVVVDRMLHDHREAADGYDLDDDAQRRQAIEEAGVDGGGDRDWSDVDAIDAEYHDPLVTVVEFSRYWLNKPSVAADQWADPRLWRQFARNKRLMPGDVVVLGFDGGRYRDATALVAVRYSDGFAQPIAVWEKPEGPAGADWEVSEEVVNFVVRRTMDRFRVLRLAADPPGWRDVIGRWAREFGGDVVREFRTNKPSEMGPAIDLAETLMRTGQLEHDGNPVLERHVGNARRGTSHGYPAIRKPNADGLDYIDAAVAWTIAVKARADLVAAGVEPDEEPEAKPATLSHR